MGHAFLTAFLALSSIAVQWVCAFSPSFGYNQCSPPHSVTPSIASIACARVILALRGMFLHSGTGSPPPYASGTLPSYHEPHHDRKEQCADSRRNHQNFSLDFFASGPGGTTEQSTSAGVYELTTFANTTVRMDVSSIAGFTGNPSCGPSAQHFGMAAGYCSPPAASFPNGNNMQGQPEKGYGEDSGLS
jgi:hypothetical protein